MFENQEQVERWIVRSLDGELSADEQLALDRELIRNPQARQMMDEYEAVDAMSASALAPMNDQAFALRPAVVAESAAARQSWRIHRLWLIPGAIAAALLALAIPRTLLTEAPVQPPSAGTFLNGSPGPGWSVDGGLVQPVSTRPSVHRAAGRDLVGIVGEDGNIYWIEVERSRTVRLPHGPAGVGANRL